MDPAASAEEPPIDLTLAHYLEMRALELASRRAATPAEQALVAGLQQAREALMARRDDFHRQATACRHARGEVYSKARVAAINAMGPTRAALDEQVRALYPPAADLRSVLKVHAQVHFADVLVAARLNLVHLTPDICAAARTMQQHEEAFAATWLAAIGDDAFTQDLRARQRAALRHLRSATRPMLLLTEPAAGAAPADEDAAALGKAWTALDGLATAQGLPPLSDFIVLPGEGATAPAGQVLRSVQGLAAALQAGHKLPAKRATLQALAGAAAVLHTAAAQGGRAGFEVDT